MQDSYYLRAIARGMRSLIAATVLGLIGVALIQVGVVPTLGIDGIKYEFSFLSWIGIASAIGAVAALVGGVSLAGDDIKEGNAQLELAKETESKARVAAMKQRAAERSTLR